MIRLSPPHRLLTPLLALAVSACASSPATSYYTLLPAGGAQREPARECGEPLEEPSARQRSRCVIGIC